VKARKKTNECGTDYSGTSAYKIQTSGNGLKEKIRICVSINFILILNFYLPPGLARIFFLEIFRENGTG